MAADNVQWRWPTAETDRHRPFRACAFLSAAMRDLKIAPVSGCNVCARARVSVRACVSACEEACTNACVREWM